MDVVPTFQSVASRGVSRVTNLERSSIWPTAGMVLTVVGVGWEYALGIQHSVSEQ